MTGDLARGMTRCHECGGRSHKTALTFDPDEACGAVCTDSNYAGAVRYRRETSPTGWIDHIEVTSQGPPTCDRIKGHEGWHLHIADMAYQWRDDD